MVENCYKHVHVNKFCCKCFARQPQCTNCVHFKRLSYFSYLAKLLMFLLYCAWLEHLSIVTYTYIVCNSQLLPIMMHPVKIQCLKKKTHNSYIHVVLIVTHCWKHCFLNYAKYRISDFEFSFPSPQNIPPTFNMGFFLCPLNARFFYELHFYTA